jgi:hypothetical protein
MNYSTQGRPRALTRAQIDAVLDGHRHRKTLKQLARELAVSTTLLRYVIRTHGGACKQAPPEERRGQGAAR